MGQKNRKTFLVIFESLFRQNKLHRTRFVVLDIPSSWDTSLLNMFIDTHMDDMNLGQDHRVSNVFELTDPIYEEVLQNAIKLHRPYYTPDIKNAVNTYVKVDAMNSFEVFGQMYMCNGFKDRHKPTSIIHIVHGNLFNADTEEIDEMIQKYILTSNTVTSFNRISYAQVLDTLMNDYRDLASLNDITLVFHDLTFGEIIDALRGWYELLEDGVHFNLDLFIVDNSNQVYQLITKNNGFDMRLCYK